jgi:serine/threonine-protein kinase
VPRAVERLVMRLLEKSPSERYTSASDVLERLQRELRALTREDPTSVIRAALARGAFTTAARKSDGAAASSSLRVISAPRAAIGHLAVLGAFALGVLAIEGGTSAARSGVEAGNRPLELMPHGGGGLRVLASPWAHVRVDGQEVETTPFARPIPLTAGKHWVTLTHPDAPAVERDIMVSPNETVTLDVTMAVGLVDDAGAGAPSAAGETKR